MQPGFEGAVMDVASVKVTATRTDQRAFRSKPGTFEWRYGRKSGDSVLYHAGIKLAELWELAGTASASSPDLAFTGGGQWKGIPDARLSAMEAIEAARADVGKWGMARLVDYCVMGTPVRDMATKWRKDEREMAFVLREDLTACARHFLAL